MATDTLVAEPIPEVVLGPYTYIAGPAGTGKTYLAKQMVRELPGTLLCATTGIAAVNLGEGTTINAALGYFDTASLVEAYTSGFLTARLGKLWRSGIRRILLDEVSMMDAEQLTVLTRALDELGGRGYVMDAELADDVEAGEVTEGATHRGIALTLIGDFAQLPPVKAPFAFESPEWARYGEATHTLTTVRRQADPAFIAAIHAARIGDRDTVCDYFRAALAQGHDQHYEGLTVLATNDAVDRFNALRLDHVHAPEVGFASRRWGKPRGDWKNIPERLVLKEGALVMILANRREEEDSPRLIYANGDLGTITQIEVAKAQVTVRLQRTGEEETIAWVTRTNLIPLEPGRAKELRALHLIEGKFEIVGGITYLPLRIAYASTVHKCQGLSCDRVQVNTREGMFRQPGLLYVALSRSRTAEGLRLVGSVDGLRERVTVHPKVQPWV